jgi:hypothetical protein
MRSLKTSPTRARTRSTCSLTTSPTRLDVPDAVVDIPDAPALDIPDAPALDAPPDAVALDAPGPRDAPHADVAALDSSLPDVFDDAPITLLRVSAVVAGGAHTCAFLDDSSVRCWGANADGQLGDGTTTRRPFATAVSELSGVTQLALGSGHSCALLADATVRCWGAQLQRAARRRDHHTTAGADRGAGALRGGADHGDAPRHLRADDGRHRALLGPQRRRADRRRDHHPKARSDGGHGPLRGRAGGGGRVPHLRAADRRHGALLGQQRLRPARDGQHHEPGRADARRRRRGSRTSPPSRQASATSPAPAGNDAIRALLGRQRRRSGRRRDQHPPARAHAARGARRASRSSP